MAFNEKLLTAYSWVRHMLVPEQPDLDEYLADHLPDGTTGDRR
jgi:hypothetical protein